MADIAFIAVERRLALSGACLRSDSEAIVDAIDAFAELVDPLTLDLTRVTALPREVFMAMIQACRDAEDAGRKVAIQTIADVDGSTTQVRALRPARGAEDLLDVAGDAVRQH